MNKRLFHIAMSLLVVLALLLGACTKATPVSTTTTKPATSTKPATTTATATATPSTTAVNKYGGTLKISWASQVAQFGYPPNIKGGARSFTHPSLEPLLGRTEKMGIYEPKLAESWDLAPDKLSYTFHLRKGVKFHDGTPFNAAAVKWNLDHLLTAPGTIMKSVSSFDIIDDYTIKANLKSWNILTIDDFADETSYIYSPTAFQDNGGAAWADTHPIGTGPFIFKEWQPNQLYRYVKNPDYWMKGLPYLDAIDWNVIPNMTTAKMALQKGEIDILREVDANTSIEVVNLGFQEQHEYVGHFILSFDSKNSTSIWSDKRMREALEYGIDKESIAKSLGKGYAEATYEIIMGARYLGDPGVPVRKYDPVKARQLLADAGYPNGGIKIQLSTSQKFNNDYFLAVQSDLGKIGIQAEVNILPDIAWADYTNKVPLNNELRWDSQRSNLIMPFTMLSQTLSASSIYYPGVKRPDGWDSMISSLIKETDRAKQLVMLENMEKLAYTDAMFIPVLANADIIVFSPKLKSDQQPLLWTLGPFDLSRTKYMYFAK